RQWLLRLALFLAARPVGPALPVATRRAAASVARAALVAGASGTTGWMARHPGAALAAVATPRTRLPAALIFCEAIGVRRLLRPGGQELQLQVFQIQTGIRRIAHVITSLARATARREPNGELQWIASRRNASVRLMSDATESGGRDTRLREPQQVACLRLCTRRRETAAHLLRQLSKL